jgi:hypothetical protein
MPLDHGDRVVQQWKSERPDYDLAPVEIIGRAGRIMEHVDRALEAKSIPIAAYTSQLHTIVEII